MGEAPLYNVQADTGTCSAERPEYRNPLSTALERRYGRSPAFVNIEEKAGVFTGCLIHKKETADVSTGFLTQETVHIRHRGVFGG